MQPQTVVVANPPRLPRGHGSSNLTHLYALKGKRGTTTDVQAPPGLTMVRWHDGKLGIYPTRWLKAK